MAVEAVLKIKEAEDKARDLIRLANEKSKQVLSQSVKQAEERKKAILDDAALKRGEIIAAASKKAEQDCESLISEGLREKERISSPDPSKFEGAVKLIVERIVSMNGNR